MHRRTLLACSLLPLAGPALGQTFPSRPVRLVIPVPPGSSKDIAGRMQAWALAARLGQPVVIENRGGAGGLPGDDLAATASPDGHTILLAGSGGFMIPSRVQPRLPRDPGKDVAPVGFIGAAVDRPWLFLPGS